MASSDVAVDAVSVSKPAEHQHHGHRERLRARLFATKKGQLPDYELLELVLTLAKPRGDTKPLAKALLSHYGSFAKVLTADPQLLLQFEGIGEGVVAAFRTIHEASTRLIMDQVQSAPVLQSWSALLDYVRVTMGHGTIEQFRVVYLDKRFRVIADRVHADGTIDRVAVFPREIVKHALMADASAIILIHNHPSGDTTPSQADLELTKAVVMAAAAIGVKIHDHLIISATSHFSFKTNGLI
jgi:DNA repair protein RadC